MQPKFSAEELQFLLSFNDCHTAKFTSFSPTKQRMAMKFAQNYLMYIGSEEDTPEELVGYVQISYKGRDCIEQLRVAATNFC